MVRFPKPLRPGDLIAVTAPSSGVEAAALPRLDLVLNHLRAQGYRIVEGDCLRRQHKDASAPAAARASELMRFLSDPAVAAVMPPWGGELACELLDRIDFDALRALPPKWLSGYSDLSTLQLPLTLVSGWATAHGPCLMDLAPTQTDALTTGLLPALAHDYAQPLRQQASARHQTAWIPFEVQVDAALQLTEPTRWQRLDGRTEAVGFRGHLIGGCLDTLVWLAGSRLGDVPGYVAACGEAAAILYLENAEMTPVGLVRALGGLRRQGWFDGLAGLLIGRSAAPAPTGADHLSTTEALAAALGDLTCPVLFDVDIGHRPPQFTLINGALATVHFADGSGHIDQAAAAAPLSR